LRLTSFKAAMMGWRQALAAYGDRRVLAVLLLGFSSGVPLLLTYSTLSGWLAQVGISRTGIGLFALVGTPYSLKFLWSPLIERLPPPLPLGRRRGWGITIQLALMAVIAVFGTLDPTRQIGTMAVLAVVVAFLSASQDIVIDAFRIEILDDARQGPGAGAVQVGYRMGMLAAGAGALFLADAFGWTVAYGVMAALLAVGIGVFLVMPEAQPQPSAAAARDLRTVLAQTIVLPFADIMRRPAWPLALLFIMTYKLGEAMAGIMAMPLYIAIGFTLTEIGEVSKIFGVVFTLVGCVVGGAVVTRLGCLKALLICGVLQSLGNLFYILQAVAGHHLGYLVLCVAAENLTGGMAGTALVVYVSSLCNLRYTATQYALLSSLAVLGRTLFASSAGALADHLGWELFFLLTTVVTVPALLLLVFMMRLPGLSAAGQTAAD
jgi:PAT family beta-lactamase induction signal transducer AmpG